MTKSSSSQHISQKLYTSLLFLLAWLFTMQAEAQKPVIAAFTPASGVIGTTVTISGINFSPIANNNTVYFGAVKAVILAATSTSLTVTVPAAATYQPISVTTNGLTAYAPTPFTVTFPGGEAGFSGSSFSDAADSITGFGTSYLAVADVDGDGQPDVAVINSRSNKISVFRNTGRIGVISFAVRIDYTTGIGPSSVIFVDLDGDGKQEMVVSNSGDSNFSIYKNLSTPGTISFSTRIDIRTGATPTSLIAGDIDGDGRPDLAVTNGGLNSISVFRNTSQGGTITFAASTDFATGKSPVAATATDIDGDGKADLAVVNYQANSISILRNTSTTGTVSFAAKTDFPVSNSPSCITAADLNADGMPDLAAGNGISGTVAVLKNLSSAGVVSFSPKMDYGIVTGAYSLTITDMDGDGRPDLVAGNSIGSRISVLQNQSLGGNLSFNASLSYITGDNPYCVAVADMDADGRPDIVSACYNPGTLSVLRNTVPNPSILSFTPATTGSGGIVKIGGINFTGAYAVIFGDRPAASFTVDSSTSITAVVDTGASGDVKVTTAYGTAQLAGFLFSRIPSILSFTPTTGGRGTVVIITGTNFTGATAVSFGGLPADSFTVISPSIIRASTGQVATGAMAISVTNPSGTGSLDGFYTGALIRSFTPTSGPVGTTVTIFGANFSKNAADNIVYFGAEIAVVTKADSNSLQVTVPAGATYQPITVTTGGLTAYSAQPFTITFKGTGAGFATSSFIDKADSSTGYFAIRTSVGDLNGDGKPDLVVVNSTSPGISVLQNTSSGGMVSFAGKKDYAVDFRPVNSSIADLDGDGKSDLLVLKTYSNITYTDSLSIFRNTSSAGAISFAPVFNIFSGYEFDPSEAAISDFDGDGKPDIAVVSVGIASVFKNTSSPGAISFAPGVNLGYGATTVFASDVDGDGKPDLVMAGDNDYVYILRNTSSGGTISFAPAIILEAGFSPLSVFVGDLDNDGLPDIAVVNGGNNSVSVYRNTSTSGAIAFEPRISYNLGSIPYNVTIGDLDGDGKPDLAIATRNNPTISLLKNQSTPGHLSFADAVFLTSYYGYDLRWVSIADINGDGKPDLSIPNSTASTVSVFVNMMADDGLPAIAIHAYGSTEICRGDSSILRLSPVAGATYQWSKDGLPIAGATDTIYTAKLSGSYSASLSNGGLTATSPVLNITVRSTPDTPVIGLGNTHLCQGHAVNLVSSSPVSNQWYKDGALLVGGNGATYLATDSGAYAVINFGNGCPSPFSMTRHITLTALPNASVQPAGPKTICDGDSAVLNANGSVHYQWNAGGNPIPGASGALFTAYVTGNYTVTTASQEGCLQTSPVTIVTKFPRPDKPTISKNGANLMSSAANGNQWYRGGIAIPGATGQIYMPADAADYSVNVTLNGCTGPTSDSYRNTVTGVIVIDNTHFIRLSPNPVRDQALLSFNIEGTGVLNIDLVDLTGKVIRRWKALETGTSLNLSGLSNTIYLARINTDNGKLHYVLKVLKE